MRINKFIALASGISRRAADQAIEEGRVQINGTSATAGYDTQPDDVVCLDHQPLQLKQLRTIVLNKPAGYVTSREGQGSKTIYDLLPPSLHHLKAVGRLDKDSSGLLLLTNDGTLAQQLTHPSYQKMKHYEVELDAPLQPLHRQMISDHGILLEDGPSQFVLERLIEANDKQWKVVMHEGRNRQIRRTFKALGYTVVKLHRTHFGNYTLDGLKPGEYRNIVPQSKYRG